MSAIPARQRATNALYDCSAELSRNIAARCAGASRHDAVDRSIENDKIVWQAPVTPRRRVCLRQARLAFNGARAACGFDDGFTPHTLRHGFATRTPGEESRHPARADPDGTPTWTTQMHYHPHVHLLVTGGGRSWCEPPGTFLVPVKALSKLIAARFRDALKNAKPDAFRSLS